MRVVLLGAFEKIPILVSQNPMISVYKLKPRFQQLLTPFLRTLHKAGVTANHITLSSILLSLAVGILFWFADDNRYFFLALPIGLFIRMALNALDGMMARVYQQQSKPGEALNELGDVISDLFIFFPLLKFHPDILYSIVIFLCLSVVNEFSGLLAKVVGGERRYDGPMGKSDRALLLGLYGVSAFFGLGPGHQYAVYLFGTVNVLLMVSTYLRVKRSLAHG